MLLQYGQTFRGLCGNSLVRGLTDSKLSSLIGFSTCPQNEGFKLKLLGAGAHPCLLCVIRTCHGKSTEIFAKVIEC